jgi:heptosyltransferase-3
MATPRFLIIRGGAIGDFILTVPVLAAVRERWPNAHIEVLGYPHIAELAKAPELVNAVRSISAKGMATFFSDRGEQDREFRDYFGQFHQIISFLYDPDEVFATNVQRVSRHYLTGLHKPSDTASTPHPRHAARQLIQVLESLALYIEDPVPKLYPQRPERLCALDFFQGNVPRPLVAVHPGSGGESKVWPIANWAALCRWLIEEKQTQVLILGGEADQANVRQLLSLLGKLRPLLATHFRLAQVAALLEHATLYIGHDSGISHLAAAVGAPSLVLFGPTSPSVWRPLGEKVRVLHGEKEWTVETGPVFTPQPMSFIPVFRVKELIEEMLAAKR